MRRGRFLANLYHFFKTGRPCSLPLLTFSDYADSLNVLVVTLLDYKPYAIVSEYIAGDGDTPGEPAY